MRYLLVGGGAAIAYGATRPTGDLDLIPARDPENLGRLADAMRALDAWLRVEGRSDQEARALPVQISGEALARIEISTWSSEAGDFDLLADLPGHGGRRYSYVELLPRAVEVTIYGIEVRVAALEDIIASKEWADRPKDHVALPELRDIAARRKP
ncbi:MAG: hypothetical protein ABIV94_08585 [Acidimicrobiales bacterium]